MERVVACQLNDYVNSMDLSTRTALLSILNEVHFGLDRGEVTAVVLLDQSETRKQPEFLVWRYWRSAGRSAKFKSYLFIHS